MNKNKSAPLKVLVVDDDDVLRLSLKSNLESEGRYSVTEAKDGIEAIELYKSAGADLVLMDVDMPRLSGLDALKQIKERNPGSIVVVLTAYASIENAVRAVKEGAYDFVAKPVDTSRLIEMMDKALQAHRMISSVAVSAPILMENGRKFIGNTQQMQKVFNVIHRLSKVDTPVLIRGASGTGKELVARALHYNSNRKDHKFVAINCSAIPENLFESELFGHEKGAFTGADQRKIGKFQYAENGTLFLDEVGDLPQLMQVKLLRVLQEKLFTPVGSNRELSTNVRIIAATNRPLEDMIKKGSFREDLFYRLNVIPMFLPSLIERKDDLESLVQFFIKKFNASQQRKITGITREAMQVLRRYDWPGNIRELENVIEHSFVMEIGHQISLSSLPESVLSATGTTLPELLSEGSESEPSSLEMSSGASSSLSVNFVNGTSGGWDQPMEVSKNAQVSNNLDSHLDDLDEEGDEGDQLLSTHGNLSPGGAFDFNVQKEAFEKEFIIKALRAFGGRINQTALHANIPKKTLLRKIEKYGINAKDFGNEPSV